MISSLGIFYILSTLIYLLPPSMFILLVKHARNLTEICVNVCVDRKINHLICLFLFTNISRCSHVLSGNRKLICMFCILLSSQEEIPSSERISFCLNSERERKVEVDEKRKTEKHMVLDGLKKFVHNKATGIAENLLCLILQSNSIVNREYGGDGGRCEEQFLF